MAASTRGVDGVAHAAGARRTRRTASERPLLTAVAPATLYVIALLVLPFLMLVYLSFHQSDPVLGHKVGFTLHNYAQLFDSPVYFDSMVGTVRLGLVVTVCSLLLGYPIAWFLARSGSHFVPLATAVVVVPLFVSVVVRSFGWMVLLGREGTVNTVLLGLEVIGEPVQFLYTEGAVTVGLVHILVPLMILPIASVLRGIDSALDDAARSLGASGSRAFWTVVFPLSLPGVGAGSVLVFSHVIAAFVLPALIGSERVKLVATMIYQQVMVIGNVPLGAALGVVMVIATFALIGLAQVLSKRLGT
ncbi:MAG: ABC transporter permease [Betaproteobacteria bacterium]|nr:ABC transporter permease [Betaproteobacteria bacterium]